MYKYCFLACFCGSQRVQRLRGRTNLSTNSGKPIKRLDRLAPNLAHMYRFIWEWIYAKQIATRDTRGHMCGLRGSTIQNLGKLSNGWTDWYHIWYTSADSSGNGHLLNTIRRSLPQRHFCFFFRGHKFKSLGSCQRARPIGTKFGTHVQIHLGMDKRQTNCPSRHKGH